MMKALGAVVALVAIFLLAGLLIIFSGAFNVAAVAPDSAITGWLLHTTMRRSVAMRSSDIVAPKSFADDQVQDGFKEFNTMCVGCHGAPGRTRSAVGKGLRPQPPDLTRAARGWDNRNLFWIVKNGIKMTGMPAFGLTHDDQKIWNIVAFVSRLPEITPEQYRQLEEQTGGTEHEHEH